MPLTCELRVPVDRESTLPDGQRVWLEGLDVAEGWLDPGPSPTGNEGPYLKTPRTWEGGPTTHRLYCRWWKGSVVRIGGLRMVVARVDLLRFVEGWTWVLEVRS